MTPDHPFLNQHNPVINTRISMLFFIPRQVFPRVTKVFVVVKTLATCRRTWICLIHLKKVTFEAGLTVEAFASCKYLNVKNQKEKNGLLYMYIEKRQTHCY